MQYLKSLSRFEVFHPSEETCLSILMVWVMLKPVCKPSEMAPDIEGMLFDILPNRIVVCYRYNDVVGRGRVEPPLKLLLLSPGIQGRQRRSLAQNSDDLTVHRSELGMVYHGCHCHTSIQ